MVSEKLEGMCICVRVSMCGSCNRKRANEVGDRLPPIAKDWQLSLSCSALQ